MKVWVASFGAALAVAGSACSIARAEGTEVTFNKDIAPLVWKHCAACHRPGEVAPFPLLSYHDVAKRAGQIQDITAQHIMPPWKPVPGHGEFANGRRLTPAEIELVATWVAGGAKEGAAADLPALPTFPDGWQLGPPDLVITLDQPVEVPAEGRDVYQNVILPFQIPTGKYLKAVEFRPGNRRVVHHAVISYDTNGRARKLDAEDPAVGFKLSNPVGRFLPGTLGIWTPGHATVPLPEGLSMPWPEKADMVLNLHLHPSGKPETEQSSLGFYFTDEPPRRTLLDLILIDKKIDIPPGEKTYHCKDSAELPIDADVVAVFPHMHMIGKDFKLTATLPDGSQQPLLWIDDWDFNWQNLYEYAKPVRLPKGTRITLETVHDNSADNPHNPKNPPERVTWGEQTFNEMSIAFVNLTPVAEGDLPQLLSQRVPRMFPGIVPPAYQAMLAAARGKRAEGGMKAESGMKGAGGEKDPAKRAAEALQKADKDGDGKLSVVEIVAALGSKVPAEQIEKIVAQFDRDGDKQLNESEATEVMKHFPGK